MAPQGAGDGSAADLVLDAAEEQRWNEAQLAEAVTQPQMRVWTYRQGAIVLGRSQHAMAEQVTAAGRAEGASACVTAAGFTATGSAGGTNGATADGGAAGGAGDGACEPDRTFDRLPLVKRGAGGGAVLVGPWLLSASLLLPLDDPRMAAVSVADSYRWLGEAMVAALASFGVQARAVSPAQRIAAPDDLKWACFAGVAPWEIVVDDPATGVARKLVGFAQRRSRHGMLLALGALMQPAPWRAMARTLGYPDAQADALAGTVIDLASVSPQPVSNGAFLAALWPHLQPMVWLPGALPAPAGAV